MLHDPPALPALLYSRGWIRHPSSLHWLAPVRETEPGSAIGHAYAAGILARHASALIPIGSDSIPETHRHAGPHDLDSRSYCLAYTFTPA